MKNEKELAWVLALVGVFSLIFMLCYMSTADAETLTVNSMRIQKTYVQYKYSHSLESESPIVVGVERTDLSDLGGLELWADTDVYADESGHVTSYVRVCILEEKERENA